MDALQLLETQHREAEALFEKVRAAEGDERAELFSRLADLLAVHTNIEEKVFYPAARSKRTITLVESSYGEHLEAKRLLAELLAADPSDDQFGQKLDALEKSVREHVEKEENELFPRARTYLGTRKLGELAVSMLELSSELEQEGSPRSQVPAELGASQP
jgi:hemerythrin-like domain-containing protein